MVMDISRLRPERRGLLRFSCGIRRANGEEMSLKQRPLHQFYRLAAIFLLFQKSSMPGETTERIDQLNDHEPDFSQIRCPLCKWQPNASSRWCCWDCWYPERFFDGCGTEWNTFTTYGVCPGCNHQWHWTMCLSCEGWSIHEDWYARSE
jgi:hypothetical protein